MTNEPLQQTAQRLYEQGRLNMEKGLLSIEYGQGVFWESPSWHIGRITSLFPDPFQEQPRLIHWLDEAYAALAALDGSIPMWREVGREWADE